MTAQRRRQRGPRGRTRKRGGRRAGLGQLGAIGLALAVMAAGTPVAAQEGSAGVAIEGPSRPSASRVRRGTPRAGSRGIVVHEGRAMQGFGGSPRGSTAYAQALNTIHETIGNRVTIYSIIVPTAQEFYYPDSSESSRRRERPNILGTYGQLAPGIRPVDAHAELAAHTEENIYFRTDHHWTGLAGYYAYRAFCRAAGVDPVPLEQLERRVVNRAWVGSLRRFAGGAELEPDEVEILVPPARAELRATPRSGPERPVPLFRERAGGYSVFLGGDNPIVRGRTSTRNGRRAILVKNSYGNAFGVHLVSHYEEVVYIDYRTFRGSLLDVLAESELPTDLLFMNGSLTSNSPAQCRMLLALLEGRD